MCVCFRCCCCRCFFLLSLLLCCCFGLIVICCQCLLADATWVAVYGALLLLLRYRILMSTLQWVALDVVVAAVLLVCRSLVANVYDEAGWLLLVAANCMWRWLSCDRWLCSPTIVLQMPRFQSRLMCYRSRLAMCRCF